jgi:hypothetical protein
MDKKRTTDRDPLQGTQIVSPVATGGGGGVFQARVGAAYLANLLTGLPTAFGLRGGQVQLLRFEARYAGPHTDDIYCELASNSETWRQFIQCKRGLNATASNQDFIDALQGAWRDFLGVDGTPFDPSRDVLVIATIAPATAANQAAKRLCEISRASVDLADFLLKVESKILDRKHKDTWVAFKAVSEDTLSDVYSEESVFQLLRCLRIDIHDLGSDVSQELSLLQALLTPEQSDGSGALLWDGLVAYVQEQSIAAATVTRQTWASTASTGLQEALRRTAGGTDLARVARGFSEQALMQLSLIATTLPNHSHIPRGDRIAQALAGLDDHQLVIITGGPGSGKSAVLSELAPLLRESGPLLFFRSDELDEPTLAAVQSLSSLPDPVSAMVALLRNGRATVVIDSLEKALEARHSGALEELLELVRRNKRARLCITTRSHALNGLYTHFLYRFSSHVVDVPPLTDRELSAAVAGSPLEAVVAKDTGVREVLRAPYYLKLAIAYTAAGSVLPQASGNDLRRLLWTERVAPRKDLREGMGARRQAAFDHVCYSRTERFAQFVHAPEDADAIASLVKDDVLVKDAVGRVAPAHDVLEDWSLFFRVESEVRSAERDWATLFTKLGSHAGMRRALRSWTAQRSAEDDEDAYALLEAALRHDPVIPQLWRDEITIGLLRSETVSALVAKLGRQGAFTSSALLKRMCHLLRVACKGPTSVDYSRLADDPSKQEIIARFGMAAPVGAAWDVLIALVAAAFPDLPPEDHAWVVQLAEDATAHDNEWHTPGPRVVDVFRIAEHVCWRDNDTWHREQSVGKRFFGLLCRCSGADTKKFETFIDALIQRLSADSDKRDLYAEQRLAFLTNVANCREATYFTPDLVCRAFWALYVVGAPKIRRYRGMLGWEGDLGLADRAAHAFFPPSVLQGPFRSLLVYDFQKGLRFVVELCNHAALHFAKAHPEEVIIIGPEHSPNRLPHVHDFRLWAAYRGLSVSSYLLNCALMALEERLLIEAAAQRPFVKIALEFILETGQSSFTTGLVASVLMAYPDLVTEKMLPLFKCPAFFVDDRARLVHEHGALAIHGGHDGLDAERQKERKSSNQLPHRRHDLEGLVLRLQIERLDLRDALSSLLDEHREALATESEVPEGWRLALLRMDLRCLKLGEPEEGGGFIPLEIAEIPADLKQVSDHAEAKKQLIARWAAMRLWCGASTQPSISSASDAADRFSTPAEAYGEFLRLREALEDKDADMLLGLKDELACALIHRWPDDASAPLQWARDYVLDAAAKCLDKDAWIGGDRSIGELRARTVISLASIDPTLSKLPQALANVITEPVWKVRRAAAEAISAVLRTRQPLIANILTTALAQYAQALDTSIEANLRHTRDLVDEARHATAQTLVSALQHRTPGRRPLPISLAAVREWTIALDAARGETPDTWRVEALAKLVRMIAEHERRPGGSHTDPESMDFEARWELGDLLASELLSQTSEQSPVFETFDVCLTQEPELTEHVLQATLIESLRLECTNADAFWRVWDRAAATILPDASLRTSSRRFHSRLEKALTVLLFRAVPWSPEQHDLVLLQRRPTFVSASLQVAGESRPVLELLLGLMAGPGRVTSVPSALPQLRNALRRAPVDLFHDSHSLWNAETVCQVAVHQHRLALGQDVALRHACLEILDRLVDAGSSLAFQLRDYLAASPVERPPA